MDIDKLLDAKLKREARSAIQDYLQQEIHSQVRDEAAKLSEKWLKNNRATIAKLIAEEFEENLPKTVKKLIRETIDHIERGRY